MSRTLIILLSGLCLIPSLNFAMHNDSLHFKKSEGKLTVLKGNRTLLGYQFETFAAPENTDTLFNRSGFIHPINSPSGDVLTQIQPPDHYHHYGLWNPWTHTTYDSDTIDFWNLKKGEGTVRFAGFEVEPKQMNDTSIYFETLHEHVILKGKNKGLVPIKETQKVSITILTDTSYTIDFDISYSVEGIKPFTILEYRYGGFTWRVTELWNQNNCEILTSANYNRNSADGSLADWFFIQGHLPKGYAGGMIMSHPSNFNHPQPIRVWPERKPPSELMANFSPTKNTDWILKPEQKYQLKYRMVVYSGLLNRSSAISLWEDYKGF